MSSKLHIKNTPEIRLAPVFEVRSAEAATGIVTGYASVFGGPPDSYGDIIAPGAFTRTLAEHKSESTTPAMLWCHRSDEPVGRWLELKQDGHGLFVRGKLNLDTQAGRETHAHIKGGDVTGFSIGFLLSEGSRKRNDDRSWTITDLDLWEISVTPIPANKRARVSEVKSLQSKSDLIEMLREGGLAKAAAARVAAGGWPALSGNNHEKATDLAQRIARATATLRTK
ncbi:HK97 family phage prohead protease [Mesorhizobium microcysteis]|uniref:HK97 family phage prohead protease n=2 Tax=Neoaquamicrobium microcysteis TaxID=2682781 RepID=A0A5D4GTT8_9HYPH|nr:HK97 family phage prohead protease [Mesorhizobium microcysteis]